MPKKRTPAFRDGRYRYTLSSYEPLEATIPLAYVTDEEVEMNARAVLREYTGYSSMRLPSDAWIRENLEGEESLDDLFASIREQLEASNEEDAARLKPTICLEALAQRLEQEVPEEEVEREQADLRREFEEHVKSNGFEPAQALLDMGLSAATSDAMFAEQARREAAKGAALDAYADHFGITADTTELPAILELSPTSARDLIAQARANGETVDLLFQARRHKTAQIVLSTCRFTYDQETPEAAHRRIAETYRITMREIAVADPEYGGGRHPRVAEPSAQAPDSRSHLRLV